jgi:hypothetical protein
MSHGRKRPLTVRPAPGLELLAELNRLCDPDQLDLSQPYRLNLEHRGILFSPTQNKLFVPAEAIPLARGVRRLLDAGVPAEINRDIDELLFRLVWAEALAIADPYKFVDLLRAFLEAFLDAMQQAPVEVDTLLSPRGRAARLLPARVRRTMALLVANDSQRATRIGLALDTAGTSGLGREIVNSCGLAGLITRRSSGLRARL